MQILLNFPSDKSDKCSRESSDSPSPHTPLDANRHFLQTDSMNQSIIHPPIFHQSYSLPSDSDCIDQLGHADSIQGQYTNGGVSGSPRRSSDPVNQHHNPSSGIVRSLGHRTSTNDPVFHAQQAIPEPGSNSISTSPSSNNSSVAFSFSGQHRIPLFSSPNGVTNTSNPYSYSQAVSNSNLPSYSNSPYGGMTTRLTDHTTSFLPSQRSGVNIGNSVPPNSGTSVRERYTTAVPETGKYFPDSARSSNDLYRSNYLYNTTDPSRHLSSAFTMAPTPHYTSVTTNGYSTGQDGQQGTPPFTDQESFHQIYSANNEPIKPTIEAKIEKGFFMSADQCWTCYRRNYFSVQCSYTLSPHVSGQPLYLMQTGSSESKQIQAMAMSLSAAVDGAAGKPIELVQHTPKRDKGPQSSIQITKLCPTPPGSKLGHLPHAEAYSHGHGLLPFGGSSVTSLQAPFFPMQNHLDQNSVHQDQANACNQPTSPSAHQHTFERIQFKSATANNGKRRAQQQYYHLIVELYADVRSGSAPNPKWVKVAHRSSLQVVVRGRSPSHYSNEGPHSSSGRGGANGASGGSGNYSSMGYHSMPMGSTAARGYGGSYSSLGGYRGSQYAIDSTPLSSHSVSSASSSSGSPVERYSVDQHSTPLIMSSHSNDDHMAYESLPPIFEPNPYAKMRDDFSAFPGSLRGAPLRIPPVELSLQSMPDNRVY